MFVSPRLATGQLLPGFAQGDEGSRTTRGEIHRRNEVMRKERESCEVQAICRARSSWPCQI